MPYTLKKNKFKYKNPDTGNYEGVDVVAERSFADYQSELENVGLQQQTVVRSEGTTQKNAVTAAGTAAVANFPATAEACDTLAGDFAATYVPDKAYAVGDYCTYQYQLYQCKTRIASNTDHTFVTSHWNLVTVIDTINDQVDDLEEQFIDFDVFAENTEIKNHFVTGNIAPTNGKDSTNTSFAHIEGYFDTIESRVIKVDSDVSVYIMGYNTDYARTYEENFKGTLQADGTWVKTGYGFTNAIIKLDDPHLFYRITLGYRDARVVTAENIPDLLSHITVYKYSSDHTHYIDFKQFATSPSSGTYNTAKFYTDLPIGSQIIFTPLEIPTGTTGLCVFLMYNVLNTDGYDTYYASINTPIVITTTRTYSSIKVGTNPYAGGKNFKFTLTILRNGNTYKSVIEHKLLQDNPQNFTSQIFKKVVCCGDSYTSGYIKLSGSDTAQGTNEDYSWVHYMGKLTGETWINCGSSGANVITWQTAERGLPKARASGAAQAYIIGLMINDSSNSDRHIPLGTTNDIGTSAKTFYGGMTQIIDELKTISPNAHIFINTCPMEYSEPTRYASYNLAVVDICEYYAGQRVHLIDLRKYIDMFNMYPMTASVSQGHYIETGYNIMGHVYNLALCDYINSHISAFAGVSRIPYTT